LVSDCWVVHGTLEILLLVLGMFSMEKSKRDKYCLDRLATYVPTLYANSSPSEYYDWEDAIIGFYYGGDLPSTQLVNLAERTFSNSVLQWWLKFQQSLIYHGDEPCTSWRDMTVVLQGRYDPSIDDISPPKKIVAKGGLSSFGNQQNTRSSWSESIINVDEFPTRQHCKMKVAAPSIPFLGPEQKLKSSTCESARKKVAMLDTSSATHRCVHVMEQKIAAMNCEPKKKAVADQNFLGFNKQHHKHYSCSFSEICAHPKEQKVKSGAVKGDGNRGLAIAESSSPAPQLGKNCASAVDTANEVSKGLTDHVSNEPVPVDPIEALSGLSLMSQEVQRDGTIATVKGQRSNIFQSECKIHDKVCKLIIDGGSFTNVISSDLVHALSLSTRRLPTPRYVQWMNKSGMLKITHRTRVKFSVGNYVDTVDCDVAPLSACHLLLGRPWQFDLDATHGGRSNSYSFVHKGILHVLKPMLESAIKAEVFAPVKKKYQAATNKPKPRTALLQGEENDVASSCMKIPVGRPETDCKVTNNSSIKVGSITVILNEKNGNALSDVMSRKYSFVGCKFKVDHHKAAAVHKRNFLNTHSKPRTALFQGGEDDEPITPHIISTPNSCVISMLLKNEEKKIPRSWRD
jgi:hypothetical protein